MTFGPGSMVDLPKHSVLIAGLDYWSGGGTEIFEARLAAKAAKLLEVPSVRLVTPPPSDDDPLGMNPHIEAFQFPEWFITQDNERDSEAMFGRTRLLVHRKNGYPRGEGHSGGLPPGVSNRSAGASPGSAGASPNIPAVARASSSSWPMGTIAKLPVSPVTRV
jgi:hypothetical protein